MATKKYSPTSPARRHMAVPSFDEVTKFTPEKKLLTKLKNHSREETSYKIEEEFGT